MLSANETRVLDYPAGYITGHKREYIEKVLAMRTRHITVVLEDIFQSQNLSAAIRTCECFGIQDIHIIENMSACAMNKRVLKGAHKWVTMLHHRRGEDRTLECFRALRQKGYRIATASPEGSGTLLTNWTFHPVWRWFLAMSCMVFRTPQESAVMSRLKYPCTVSLKV